MSRDGKDAQSPVPTLGEPSDAGGRLLAQDGRGRSAGAHGGGAVSCGAGGRVRLRPIPGGDILDATLAGRLAVIEGIDEDEGGRRSRSSHTGGRCGLGPRWGASPRPPFLLLSRRDGAPRSAGAGGRSPAGAGGGNRQHLFRRRRLRRRRGAAAGRNRPSLQGSRWRISASAAWTWLTPWGAPMRRPSWPMPCPGGEFPAASASSSPMRRRAAAPSPTPTAWTPCRTRPRPGPWRSAAPAPPRRLRTRAPARGG